MTSQTLVLDTNIVLDLLVFSDAQALPLAAGLDQGALLWFATVPMRDELQRVLGYAHITARLAYYELDADNVLKSFDRLARIVDVAPRAPLTCSDPDDQKFIDLAVALKCLLLSKDAAVLALGKRLLALDAAAASALPAPATQPITTP